MKNNLVAIIAAAVTTIAVAGLATAGNHGKKNADANAASSQMTILDTARAGGFTTLVTAIEAAGLQDALAGKGPLTVFAPTDEAFKKIPKEKLDALLADKEALKSVLLYHVVDGAVTSGEVVKLKSAKTLEGDEVKIAVKNGVMINESKVTKADILASNGVIHVIDTVLLPPTE